MAVNKKDYNALMQYGLWLLSKRRYTTFELQKKLLDKAENIEDVGAVIRRLKELKYLDDEAYVRDWVSSRRRFKPRGIYMMRQELMKKGVDKSDIDEHLNSELIDETVDAIALLNKKRRVIERLEGQERRNKIFSILKNKGFSPQSVYKAIDSW